MLKLGILVLLVFQTSLNVLLMRRSRLKDSYSSALVVLYVEILKFSTCLLIFYVQNGFSFPRTWNNLKEKIFFQNKETVKLMVPSFLYAIQNNLLFFALANLDATLFQITYQLKILVTSLMSLIYLKKRLFMSHWIALILLMVGVVVVQLSYHKKDSNFNPSPSTQMNAQDPSSQKSSSVLGFLSVIAACFSSSYSGIYFEKLIKTTGDNSLIIKNLQMGIFSIFFSSCMALHSENYDMFQVKALSENFSSLVALIILVQCFGGLLVSVVIKYADNILKGFATSISIIVSCICSYFFLDDLVIDLNFFFGTSLVLIATVLYSMTDSINRIGLLGMLIKYNIIKEPSACVVGII